MLNVLDRLDQMIDERHLLKHPFYTKWAEGTLPLEALQEYARQYYAFESAMPRYLSALHTRTPDKQVRQQILDNLWDEEHGKDNHAELWLRFAEGIGVSREDVASATPNEATQALVDMYSEVDRATSRSRPASRRCTPTSGRCPQVAGSKIDGLERHYGITDARSLKFFMVHGVLDIEHSGAERKMLGKLIADSDPEPIEAGDEPRARGVVELPERGRSARAVAAA